MMRWAMAVLLLLHGVAHLPGFAVAWKLMHSPELPYRTTIFAGRVDLGDAGARLFGAAWLLVALLFGVLAWMDWTAHPAFRGAAITIAGVSSVLCLAAWPEARIGLGVNALILLLVLLL